MKLTIIERLTLKTVLPKKCNIVDAVLVKDLAEQLDLSKSEIEKYHVRHETGSILFDDEADEKENLKEIDLSASQSNLVKKQLIELDSKKELLMHHVSLYEKFLGLPDGIDVPVREKPEVVEFPEKE